MNAYQSEFIECLYKKRDFSFVALDEAENFDIYINNCFWALRGDLGEKFPICKQILGIDFFENAAQQFIIQSPLNSGCVNQYGADFAGFLEPIGAKYQLPFLHEIAKIEYAKYCAEISAAIPAIRPSEIPEDICDIRVIPSLSQISCEFNSLEIFTAHLQNRVENLEFIAKKSFILVWLDEDYQPSFAEISEFSFNLIANIKVQGFENALSTALSFSGDLAEAQNQFAQLCELGIFTT